MRHPKKRVTLTGRDVYDAYALMYIFSITDDPVVAFECIWACEPIRDKFLWEMENICLRELRHMDEQVDINVNVAGISFAKNASEDDKHFISENKKLISQAALCTNVRQFCKDVNKICDYLCNHYGSENGEDDDSNRYSKNWLNLVKFHRACGVRWNMFNISRIFSEWDWDSDYGGNGWAKIAMATYNLRAANPSDFFYIFDRTIDFVHNNGTVLGKLQIADDFVPALNKKAYAPSVKVILPLCSTEVRQLYAKAMRNASFWHHERNLDSIIAERKVTPKKLRRKKNKNNKLKMDSAIVFSIPQVKINRWINQKELVQS